jgi:hypothetical protein
MKRFGGIVESPVAPPTDMIWLYNHEFKYFSNGRWTLINNPVGLSNPEASETNIIAPVIKLGNTAEDKANNVKVCSEFSTNDVVSIDIEGIFHDLHYDVVGVYHNGTVSILEGNHCTVFDINFNDGTVSLDSKYDTSQFLPYTILEIGNSKCVKSTNLKRLRAQTVTGVTANTFFVGIDYGYGVGNWNSSTGGQAHIVTAYGDTVYYSISEDGAVVKEAESPDIYLSYINAGGTKTKEQFVNELVDLIG